MGVYGDRVLPRIVDRVCGARSLHPLRQSVCEGLHGSVLEIGFGSGLNVPFYPDRVEAVAAVEPANAGWQLASGRIAESSVPIERVGLEGESIPLPDASCQTAISTWTLCTIPDVSAALAEVRRVLEPGGTLHFVEHGLAPDPNVQRWQHRLEPVQRRLAGGCHLSRPILRLLTDAGFEPTDEIERFYGKLQPKMLAANYLGVVISP